MKPTKLAIIILVIISFCAAFYFSGLLPPQIAIHWNAAGQPNGYGDTTVGLFILPIVSLALAVLLLVLPRFDPLKKNYPKYREVMSKFALVLVAFMLYLEFAIIAFNSGTHLSMTAMLAPALGVLFIKIGYLIKDSRRNWFVGIRTPWTLSSEKVWRKTHELGSKLFIASGVIAFLSLMFPGELAVFFIIVPVLATAVAVVAYSYVAYKKEKRKR